METKFFWGPISSNKTIKFPLQAAPQPVVYVSGKIASFRDSMNISCEHVKSLSCQHNSILAV